MRIAQWRVAKQYKKALSNDNNAAIDELKPVTPLRVQILFQVGIFLQNACRVKYLGKKYPPIPPKPEASVHKE